MDDHQVPLRGLSRRATRSERLRVAAANAAPVLGRALRLARAALDAAAPRRPSYAQHGEDAWVWRALGARDLAGGIYVDVGAYHPSRLSNTYLLYRHGLSGVLVEPNPEMAALLRRFRPRDRVIPVGCDAVAGTRPLFVYSTPADTSFADERIHRNEREKGLRRVATLEVPVAPLDDVLAAAAPGAWVYFLSVDAEGLDHRVLAGASRTLGRTLFVCVECAATNPASAAAATALLEERGFRLVHEVSWNRIYEGGAAS